MFVRFVSLAIDPQSNSSRGVFTAIHALRDENLLEKWEEAIVIKALKWLAMHLTAPAILEDPEHYRAICWFKDSANEPIKRIRELVPILENHDVQIQTLSTTDPGIVIYEDGWQIVAKPRRSA